MTKKNNNIDDLRDQINDIDEQILVLLNRRMSLVADVGKIKSSSSSVFYVPEREVQVYKELFKKNKGLLSDTAIRAIFKEIMSAALALENPMMIAHLGGQGAYTHEAALKKFGESLSYKSCGQIKDVFDEVLKKHCAYGVVPIENSTEGVVSYTLDMFMDYDLSICSEVYLPIEHDLMAKYGQPTIERIYSHPQVFGQCRHWLHQNYPKVELIDTDSTTSAAMKASEDPASAVIGSALLAELYELHILENSIQDLAENVTRFLVIGHQKSAPTGQDKTSLLFALKDEPGVLSKALDVFKEKDINLSKIESRPSKKEAWKYHFFIDLEGHMEDKPVASAIKKLEKLASAVKILGSYPCES